MKKRLISLLLALAMLTVLTPQFTLTAKAATSGTCGDNLYWSFDEITKELNITGSGPMTDWSSGISSGSAAPWNGISKNIQSISLPRGLTSIGNYAFYGCGNLSNIIIPDSVTSIGYCAFYNCTGLSNVNIPENVTSIGGDAFRGCSSLSSVIIPDSVTSIGRYSFYNCTSLSNVIISENVTSIDEFAFSGCSSLSSVTIPNSVTSIGDRSFYECSGLTSVIIFNEKCKIYDNRYTLGSSRNITIYGYTGSTAESYYKKYSSYYKAFQTDIWSFDETTGTLTLYYRGEMPNWPIKSDSLIGQQIVRQYPPWYDLRETIEKVVFAENVTSIGDYAFCNCSNLKTITIPDGVTRIGKYAFYSCSSLENAAIPDSVDTIESYSFYSCSSLTEVTVPDGVTGIGDQAFRNCGSLKSVIIPESVKSIGQSTFGECSSLESITIYNEQCTIINDSSALGVPGKTTIHGITGSTAESYAKDFNYKFVPIPYHTVSFDANGGTEAPEAQAKTVGITLTLSSVVPEKNYTVNYEPNDGDVSPAYKMVRCEFKNWNTAPYGNGTAYDPGAQYTTDADVILYAQWINPSVGALPTPSWQGHIFYGWFTAAGIPVTDAMVVNEDMTIFAQWDEPTPTPQINTVAYDANGGVGAPEQQTKTKGVDLTLSTACPTKSFKITYNANDGSVSPAFKTVSCTFNNWNTAKSGSGTTYSPGAQYTADADVTLYAQWTNPKAGELSTPTRDGYDFDGWYTSASGGNQVTASTTVSGNMTIYAHWTQVSDTYSVSYNSNGGTGSPSAQTKTEGVALTLSEKTPTKAFKITYNANGGSVSPASKTVSCTFNNWNTVRSGSGTSYNPGAQYTADANVTLYAQWTNPTAGELPTPQSNDVFVGWFTAAEGGDQVTDSTTVSGNMTIYAHWAPPGIYTVMYDANGGTGKPAEQQETIGTALKLSEKTPTKTFKITYDANGGSVSPASKTVSCTFNNWNTAKNGSGTSYNPGEQYTADTTVTLYAQWTNPTIGTLPTPTLNKDGVEYRFKGWYTAEGDGGVRVTEATVVTGDMTIYAQYEPIIPIPVLSGECGRSLKWEFDESSGKLTITGSGAMYNWDKDIDTPPWFSFAGKILSLSLPDELTSIGRYAFYGCNSLEEVKIIPNSKMYIEKLAFKSCNSLKSVTIGQHVTNIEAGAFDGCTALEKVTILNPKCDIAWNSTTLGDPELNKTVIFGVITAVGGVEYSTAKDYAEQYGYTFKELFVDVPPDAYYVEPIYWAVEKEVTNGTSDSTFSPESTCTRAQVVTFLWRANGSPEPTITYNPFTDVQSGAYYYKAVLWAVENEITNGVSATAFGPDRGCTRGQVVTFLWRSSGKPIPKSSGNPFADVKADAYYYNPVLWAVEKGVTKGTSPDKFSPDATCTRCQIVTFLYRAIG